MDDILQHKLPQQQIKKHLKSIDLTNPEIQSFLKAVGLTYTKFDQDILYAENVLNKSLKELFEVYSRRKNDHCSTC